MTEKMIFGLITLIFLFSSCEKDYVSVNNAVQQDQTTKITIESNNTVEQLTNDVVSAKKGYFSFKTLNQALHCTGLFDALLAGEKTIYAPSDAAFDKLGLNADNVCELLDKEALTKILLYHVAEENISLRTKGCQTMLDGNIVQLNQSNHRFFVNKSKLYLKWTQRGHDYKLRIYAINEVLTPPANNIVATAASVDMFSSLVAAVLAADSGIAEALSDEDAIFTVFAPTNEAFENLLNALGLNNLNELVDVIGVEALSTVLLYHVVDACAFSNDLTDGLSITTLQGEDIVVDLNNLSIIDKSGAPSGLVVEGLDVLTSNGIVHTINKVLLPQAILDEL